MPEKPSDLVQGTLDMLVLKTVALEPMHGYGIAVRLEDEQGHISRECRLIIRRFTAPGTGRASQK